MRIRALATVMGVTAVAALLAPTAALGAADLAVSLTATDNSLPFGGAETSEIALTVKNEGNETAAGVTAKTTVGNPTLIFGGFISITQGSGTQSSNDITTNFGTLAAGASATLKWNVTDGTPSGVVDLLAETSASTGGDTNKANDTTGLTIEVPALISSKPSLAFGTQLLGTIGSARTVTVTNAAAIPLQVSRAVLTGEDFVVSADECAGASLAVGNSCQVALRFAPAATGARSGALTVESSTFGVSPLEVALTGAGSEPVVAPPPASHPSPDDVSAATLAIGAPKSISARKFRKGFLVRVTPSEPVALELELFGKARLGALASALDLRLFSRSLPLADGARRIKVRPAKRLLGKLRRKVKLSLRLRATDAAGNVSTAARPLVVKPALRGPKKG